MTAGAAGRSQAPFVGMARGVAVAVAVAIALVSAAPVQATSFSVTTTSDSGPGSLRQAILDANAVPGADTITFAVTGTITLGSSLPTVTDALTIDGPGAASLTISGANAFRVLKVSVFGGPDVALELDGLTIADGYNAYCCGVAFEDDGGGVLNFGTLTVSNSAFSGNFAFNGGAISSARSLSVTNTTFSGNRADNQGGAIENNGALTVTDSTFTGGSASGGGAITTGLYGPVVATIANTTFSGNSALAGGGIVTYGMTTITNSTFSANDAGYFGGGGLAVYGGTTTVTNSTLSGNSTEIFGGGLKTEPGAMLTLRNTIVANNPSGGNCHQGEPIADGGGNLSWPDTSCPGINQDPLLDPTGLQDNGGPTETIALQPGSPAIDAAVLANCPPTDQRGVPRPQGAGCDIGAYEREGRTLTALSPVHAWIGLKNGDDQGTKFDLYGELLKNGTPVASGLERCITGVTRNPSLAKEAIANWDPFPPVAVNTGDVLSLRLSTRIGTNPNGTKCAGSHGNAAGLRVYYDSTSRQSRFDATLAPDPSANFYLHSDGNLCANAESTGVTTRYLDSVAPGAASAKCKDSGGVNFAGGNPYAIIGVWSMAPEP